LYVTEGTVSSYLVQPLPASPASTSRSFPSIRMQISQQDIIRMINLACICWSHMSALCTTGACRTWRHFCVAQGTAATYLDRRLSTEGVHGRRPSADA